PRALLCEGAGMSTCPCCGRQIEPNLVFVDLDTGALAFRGRAVRLTPQQAVVAAVLSRAMPRVVAHATIVARVWGERKQPSNPIEAISVHCAAIRRRLRSLGLTIQTIREEGCRMEIRP